MNIYALITNNMVVNTIVADPTFLPVIAGDYDTIARIDNDPTRPGVGWSYVGGVYAPPPDAPPEE